MKKIVVANLKMNLDYETNVEYVNYIKNKIDDSLEVIICPTSLYLYMYKGNNYYKLGAQNVYCIDKGSYTGEVSPSQLQP
jgi:triosephosphate isomerase